MLPIIVTIAMIGDPMAVQVLSANQSLPVVRAAQALRNQLAGEQGLRVASDVLVAAPAVKDATLPLSKAATALEQAQQSYSRLDPDSTLTHLNTVEDIARARTDSPDLTMVLAKALRLRGLTYLFLDRPKDAAAAFISANFIDVDFSPSADLWPPEARLAYADAVAQSRRQATGSLSIRVQPTTAAVWLDGRFVSLGPATVTDLDVGAHYLLVTCAGHKSMAAVVSIRGNAMLDEASIYLDAIEQQPQQLAAELAAAVGGLSESRVALQVAAISGGARLVFVGSDNTTPSVIVFDAQGQRVSGSIPLIQPSVAAQHVAKLLKGESLPAPATSNGAWYEQWYTWVAAGTIVAGGVVLGVVLSQDNPDRVSFHIGGFE